MELPDLKAWAANGSGDIGIEGVPDVVTRNVLVDIWEFCQRLDQVLTAMGPMVASMMPPDQAASFLGSSSG